MNVESPVRRHYGAVVVGGGQAGLSASHYLSAHGVDHVVFEKQTLMHKWRDERWDSFCLVTPNWQCQLPGHPYDGDAPHGFMVRDEILAYLERFKTELRPPAHELGRLRGQRHAAQERVDPFLLAARGRRGLGAQLQRLGALVVELQPAAR